MKFIKKWLHTTFVCFFLTLSGPKIISSGSLKFPPDFYVQLSSKMNYVKSKWLHSQTAKSFRWSPHTSQLDISIFLIPWTMTNTEQSIMSLCIVLCNSMHLITFQMRDPSCSDSADWYMNWNLHAESVYCKITGCIQSCLRTKCLAQARDFMPISWN